MLILERAVEAASVGLPVPSGTLRVLRIGVEDLEPEVHGRFDVVFSANELGHVDDPMLGIDRMQALLADCCGHR